MKTIRAFIAIDLDERLKRELAHLQEKLKAAEADVKWVAPKNLHLTLKFLGEILPTQIDDVESAMIRTAGSFSTFHMDVGELGAFPNKTTPEIIWAGVTKRLNLLLDISRYLDEELSDIDIAEEKRAFTAHITLGRLKKPAKDHRLAELLTNTHIPSGVSQKVERLTLFRSDLFSTGAQYEILSHARLNA
ncbi:MAG: RNA 2',3'-cyclic phosphodiesterase [Candidatus Omnitrophica bacterium]|nr:RNA 2',3'-cyclic phosphodiesterase [Candidatus Omnitrophota bacterium]